MERGEHEQGQGGRAGGGGAKGGHTEREKELTQGHGAPKDWHVAMCSLMFFVAVAVVS